MLASWSELEGFGIDRLCRRELTDAIRDHDIHLPFDLRQPLDEQPVENLRMLLLTARLLHLLRRMWQPSGAAVGVKAAEVDTMDFEIVDAHADTSPRERPSVVDDRL